jgi:hypothetical protein
MTGYAGETLTEFLLGDEALKGMSIADKLANAGKVAAIFEKSPRLMRAVQSGVDIVKAIGTLGSEEQAVIKKSPVLARLVTAGMDAIRQGVVQGAQTEVKSGGDTAKAVKEGAGMTAVSAGLGGAGAVIGGELAKAGKAAKTVETLGKVAESAPSQPELTDATHKAIESAKQTMHSTYDTGIKDIFGGLDDATVPLEGSPLQNKAKKLIESTSEFPEGLTKEQRESVQGVVPGTDRAQRMLKKIAGVAEEEGGKPESLLDKEFGGEKKELPEPPEDMTVKNLIKYRETLGEISRDLSYDDKPTLRAVYGLIDGVDDTISKMAENSGDPAVSKDYEALRQAYKEKVKFFQPSDKPSEQLAYNTIRTLRSGTKDEVGKYLFSGGNVRAKIGAVQELLGPDQTKQLGKDIFKTMVSDSGGESANANPANLISKWNKIPEEARDVMFDTSVGQDAIKELMADTKSAATIQQLMRVTMAGTGGAALGSLTHSGLGTLLGLVMAEGTGGFAAGRKLLDHVATHPATWKALGIASKASAKAGQAGKIVGPAIKQQAAQTLMGKPSIANVYSGAGSALGGEQ